ncbi:hypothetical protein [Listeria grandensis]|uniref:hypothetical protein n=1 Tax=Listeria grandensis TaxID=1494963 RepID=UPI0004B1A9D2|nr:hypothetical protein [Listeria grandensis]
MAGVEAVKVLPHEEIELQVVGEVTGEMSANLVLVEYTNDKKIVSTLIKLNTTNNIKLSKYTRQIRIALKISGKGLLNLKKCSIKRIYQKNEVMIQDATTKQPRVIQNLKQLKVACILDEFSHTCFSKEMDLITFSPENWRRILEQERPDMLLVESAWHGNSKSWEYKIGKYSNERRSEIKGLLKWCQKNGIPTIFWNKEDPIHFEKFIDTAKLFDYIYTTDANMIPEYKKESWT